MLKLRYLSLLILVLQNTALVLTMRYSRTIRGPQYLSSTAVAMAEGVKVLVCLSVLLYSNGIIATVDILKREWKFYQLIKVGVPAVLYAIQNNLLYTALTHLDAATYQVTYQLKILTTALFSVLMLKKQLTRKQWVSLILLTLAVALVQIPTKSPEHKTDGSYTSSLVGLVAIMVACLTSGFAGVYTELLLKTDASIWVKSMQLCSVCTVTSVFGAVLSDWAAITENGFLQGYTAVVWIVIMLQALGGLVIAMVMKYADNILKGFAASISIILSCLVSYFILEDFTPSIAFLLGSTLVVISSVMYGQPAAVKSGSKQDM